MTMAAAEPVVELRCKGCKKLLAKVSSVHVTQIKIQIQCPRCNRIYDMLE